MRLKVKGNGRGQDERQTGLGLAQARRSGTTNCCQMKRGEEKAKAARPSVGDDGGRKNQRHVVPSVFRSVYLRSLPGAASRTSWACLVLHVG